MRIMVTGGAGLLGKKLLEFGQKHVIMTYPHQLLDVTNYTNVEGTMAMASPDVVIHCAAMTRPMAEHDVHPERSIHTNIIGSANVARAIQAVDRRIKLVYISTDYVYPGMAGPYKEDASLQPINNYARSKLGGEMAAQMLANSLILRCAFTQWPFPHPRAFIDCLKSYLYVDEAAQIILRLAASGYSGIVNVGGKRQTVYDFARVSVPDIGKIERKDIGSWVPADTSMDLTLMNRLLELNP